MEEHASRLAAEKLLLAEQFEGLRGEQLELAQQTCEAVVIDKLHEYERVVKAFSKYFCEDEISVIMDRKAEKTMVANMTQNTATSEDVMYIHSLIESLNERMKHVSSVQNEVAMNLEPVKNAIKNFDQLGKR